MADADNTLDLETLRVRFAEKWVIDQEAGCWMWTASTAGQSGYGQIKIPGARRQLYAHRLSYLLHVGAIPEGMSVLHRCDTPLCVNPEHLFLGDHKANAQDMRSKGRHLYGERNAQAKLSESEARALKAAYLSGVGSQAEIAEAFGVSKIHVSRIARGERWAHLELKAPAA